MKCQSSPFVSVIVPIYNATCTIDRLLTALATQTYPVERFEILLVDNGSDDDTIAKIKDREGIFINKPKILHEINIQGSYAARNRGINESKGDIIAFTDADCIPISNWMESGVRCLIDNHAELVGGQVTFIYATNRPTAAELIDARINMQIESDIVDRGVAKTANLFVRRHVFDLLGYFHSHLKSGGDVAWTQAATRSGHKLVFCPQAEVYHPARSWIALFIKQLRVGEGQIAALHAVGVAFWKILVSLLKSRRPKKRLYTNVDSGLQVDILVKCKIFLAFFWSIGATLLGRIIGIMKNADYGDQT